MLDLTAPFHHEQALRATLGRLLLEGQKLLDLGVLGAGDYLFHYFRTNSTGQWSEPKISL